jgi:hypothetical protein
MIALRREPVVCALDAVRVLELPKFARTSAATYWHIPRSAERHDGRLSVRCWCGVSFHGQKPILLTDVEPAENVCGTCSGRWEGVQGAGPLIFTPRDDFAIPTWCPSTDCDDRGDCVACGHSVRVSWFGGVGRHRPGEFFAELCRPCPDHGWRNAGTRNGRVVCWAHVGYGWGYCDFDCGPRSAA